MKACNTKLANSQAKRKRKKQLPSSNPAKNPWIYVVCQHPNRYRRTRECQVCHARRVMEKKTPLKQERPEHDEETKRFANKKRKSYHIPNSDDDIGSSDGEVYKGKKKLQTRDEKDSDEAEFQLIRAN
ncbi:hypothetical protein PsorP6_018838 [Peronosclerospora sorghi]|nr:hypothetical protein PsorP6_018838 [Peronosclerospora sorghi]